MNELVKFVSLFISYSILSARAWIQCYVCIFMCTTALLSLYPGYPGIAKRQLVQDFHNLFFPTTSKHYADVTVFFMKVI